MVRGRATTTKKKRRTKKRKRKARVQERQQQEERVQQSLAPQGLLPRERAGEDLEFLVLLETQPWGLPLRPRAIRERERASVRTNRQSEEEKPSGGSFGEWLGGSFEE